MGPVQHELPKILTLTPSRSCSQSRARTYRHVDSVKSELLSVMRHFRGLRCPFYLFIIFSISDSSNTRYDNYFGEYISDFL
jgi:hypothetical protein